MESNQDVFISHSSADSKLAYAMCHYLEEKGIRCWIAPRDVQGGTEYAEAIIMGIRNCKIMVVLFNKNANDSIYVKNEVERAFNYKSILIPFKVDQTIASATLELFLGSVHSLDATDGNPEDCFDLLYQNCARVLGKKEPILEEKPVIPINTETKEQTLTQEIKATESPKSVETEVEIETKDVLENIPTRFFNLNRLLIGVILWTLVGEFVFVMASQQQVEPVEIYESLLLLCIISSSILFFKPSKIILRITITVFALLCLGLLYNNYIFLSYFLGTLLESLIIFIALFCSFMSFNKTAFVFYILAFLTVSYEIVSYSYFNSATICFLLIYLCSIIVFFFYNKYFGKFLIGAICFMNLVILLFSAVYEVSGHYENLFLLPSNQMEVPKYWLLMLLLSIIELSSKIQPKVLTR